jgi:Ca2+-binding RTX toxin-like protein
VDHAAAQIDEERQQESAMTTIPIVGDNIQTIQTTLAQTVQGVVINGAPSAATLALAVNTIDQALDSASKANTAGTTPLTTPNNFRFFDAAVDVGGSVTGDVFKGTTPGIVGQFLDLTPDTLGISALTPNQFLMSGSGNDLLSATGGRNILDGGSGANTFIGGAATATTPATDTFLSDATSSFAVSTIFNFHSGDDAAITGLTAKDYTYQLKDTFVGLEIDAGPVTAGKPPASMLLQGYTTADIGTKLSMGFSSTPGGTAFMFIHVN